MAEVHKSPCDPRTYQYAQLPNGLKCLVISDPQTDFSAAAMCVASGSLRDPKDTPGLSHFLEHMLFLGTAKYPDENTYHAFIREHAGVSNAYTGHEETNYFFSVAKERLEAAVDIFAQFFIAPLFTDSCVDREMHAVDSEHSKNLKSDEWRVHQLTCAMAAETHPFNHFATGSLQTLKVPGIRARLIAHYRSTYSAQSMAFVLLGKEDVHTLMTWCEAHFSKVPNYTDANDPRLPLPFEASRLGTITKVRSVMDRKEMRLMWQFPGLRDKYTSKPHAYISHLLGHEGKNSVFAMLKEEGLALELHAGADSYSYRNYSLFEVSIEMTEKGMKNYDKVAEVVCQYIAMLREKGVAEWVFDEIKNLSRAKFQFKSKSNPMNYTCRLASSLHIYPPQHLLTAMNLVEDYRPDLICELISLLVPSNLMIFLISNEFEAECIDTEQWYGTKYHTQPIPSSLKERLLKPSVSNPVLTLALPPRNPYIPDFFSVLPPGTAPCPALVFQSDIATVYHKQDTTFQKDSVLALAHILCSDSGYFQTAIGQLCGEFWKRLFLDRTRELTYSAGSAGLHLSVSNTTFGVGVTVQGFTQHFGAYLEEVCSRMANFEVTPSDARLFETYLDDTRRALSNHLLSQPYQQAMTACTEIFCANASFTQEELRKALPRVALEDLIYFSKRWLRTIRLEWIIIGNLSSASAVDLAGKCAAAIVSRRGAKPMERDEIPPELHASIPTDSDHPGANLVLEADVFDKSNRNSCAVAYWQVGEDQFASRAALLIVESLLKEPCFSTLRTQQQLGYIVFSAVRCKRRILGYYILVQSHVCAPAGLSDHITGFIISMRRMVAELSEELFITHKKAVLNLVTKRDVSLEEEFARYAAEMLTFEYQFERRQKLAEAVEKCTVREVQEAFERVFFREKKRMDVEFVSANLKESHTDSNARKQLWKFTSTNALKRALPTYASVFHASKL